LHYRPHRVHLQQLCSRLGGRRRQHRLHRRRSPDEHRWQCACRLLCRRRLLWRRHGHPHQPVLYHHRSVSTAAAAVASSRPSTKAGYCLWRLFRPHKPDHADLL
jgi:hypothetical protein